MIRLLILLVLCISAAAHARMPLGTPEESISKMFGYGWCVVREDPSESRRILGHAPGSSEERRLLKLVRNQRCLSGYGAVEQLDFSPLMLRGAIAEWVYWDDVEGGKAGKQKVMVPPFAGLSPEEIAALDPSGREALVALDFAQCILAAAPDPVKALLRTRPTHPPEERAFGELSPYLGPCLADGAQLKISKPQLRGFLAEAAYRSAYAAAHGSK